MMKVLLIRHAHAIDGQPGGDAIRWLTEKGRQVAHTVGDKLRADGLVPDFVISSPLARALQTAELVARGAKYRGLVEVADELAPEGSIDAAAELLHARQGLVAAVGHEPDISALASLLTGRSVGSFKKGQAVLVKDGKIDYRLDPDTL